MTASVTSRMCLFTLLFVAMACSDGGVKKVTPSLTVGAETIDFEPTAVGDSSTPTSVLLKSMTGAPVTLSEMKIKTTTGTEEVFSFDGAPRQQSKMLEDISEGIERILWRRPNLQHLTRGGFFKPAEKSQERGFSAARRSDQADYLPLRDGERNIVQNFDRTIKMADVLKLQIHFNSSRKVRSPTTTSRLGTPVTACARQASRARKI